MDKTASEVIAARQSQVNEQLMVLSDRTEELKRLVGSLSERLASVLRDEVKTAGDEECPEAELASLPNALRTQNDSLRESIGRIDSILSRIEL